MKHQILTLWAHHRMVLLLFIAAVALLIFFATRTTMSMMYWMDPEHRDQTLEGWMTPRYVQMSYDIPPDYLGPALFLDKDAPMKRRTLTEIAADNDITLAELQARIDAAAADWRSQAGNK